ncbi:olfactory receptor 51E2-like [Pogoniulus pusillus]|uniref:olfactory receptor 51E2-like n=1 Tax=Pogoniulus pusillus TaxID=488313 RepID=UPI0030B9325D
MPFSNISSLHPPFFILATIPGWELAHFWLCCLLYALALAANGWVLLAVSLEPSLHLPNYLFLRMLASVDLALATTTLPRALAASCCGSREITFGGCLLQLFLIHSLSAVESSLLLAMALDRLVAICQPLRHAALLPPAATARLGLLALARGTAFFLPLPLLLLPLPFCGPRLLSHPFCLHQDVMNLACADITPSRVYGLAAVLAVMGVDAFLICLSYLLILRAVLRLASRRERLRALGSCLAHLGTVLAFYVPLLGLSVLHRWGRELPPVLHTATGSAYLAAPAVHNPIAYGLGSRQLRRRLRALLPARAAH